MSIEFKNQLAAEAAFNADPMNLDKLDALTAAEAIHFSALGKAKKQWEAVPYSEAKISAETNADDTMIEQGENQFDRLQWFRYALASL